MTVVEDWVQTYDTALVPDWIKRFDEDAQGAVDELLTAPDSALARDDPVAFLVHAGDALGETSGFVPRLDAALRSWLEARWPSNASLDGVEAPRLALAFDIASEVHKLHS